MFTPKSNSILEIVPSLADSVVSYGLWISQNDGSLDDFLLSRKGYH
jgi:hypothetical protein